MPPETFSDQRWMTAYRSLAAFQDRHGHTQVPESYATRDGVQLQRWIARQRTFRRAGTLADDRVALLDALPSWRWSIRDEGREVALAALAAYKAAHGHPNVPQSYTYQGSNVGLWLTTARRTRRRGTLKPDLEHALEKLGIDWEPPSDKPRMTTRCNVPECAALSSKLGFCEKHYHRLYQYGSPVPVEWHIPPASCPVSGCDRSPFRGAWCVEHLRLVNAGHGRTAYRKRDRGCGGRCEVCRADHVREQRAGRRRAAEEAFPAPARRRFIAQLWAGVPLDEACAEMAMTPTRFWNLTRQTPKLAAAADAALMATRDPKVPHASEYTYKLHGCRCAECRAAKAAYR